MSVFVLTSLPALLGVPFIHFLKAFTVGTSAVAVLEMAQFSARHNLIHHIQEKSPPSHGHHLCAPFTAMLYLILKFLHLPCTRNSQNVRWLWSLADFRLRKLVKIFVCDITLSYMRTVNTGTASVTSNLLEQMQITPNLAINIY